MTKSRKAKATSIPAEVKRRVYERDGGLCIFCRRPGAPNAHVLSRAHLGKGVERNIVTACAECHRKMDQTVNRKIYLQAAEDYLRGIYGEEWKDDIEYRKGMN